MRPLTSRQLFHPELTGKGKGKGGGGDMLIQQDQMRKATSLKCKRSKTVLATWHQTKISFRKQFE